MAATIPVKISDGSTIYTLKVDRAEHQFTRQPTVAPLPGDSSGNPSVLVIDFGMSVETINISGIIDNASSIGSTTAIVYPSKAQMEAVSRTWWSKCTDWSTASGMPTLTIQTGDEYKGIIKALTFTLEAAHETFYPFTMQWQVHSKVSP